MALTGFFDESGEHGPDGKLRRLTLGGFFIRWDRVCDLRRRWREALHDESLTEFHMKNIASDEHDYFNWSPERRRRLDRFTEILADCANEFASFSYAVDPYRSAFKDTYEAGLDKVLTAAASLADRTGDHVHLVFAKTHEISHARIGEYFDQANWGGWLSSYKVARSRDEPALQAAEIVARGLKRLMEDGKVMPSFFALAMTGKPSRFWPENPVAASALVQAERHQLVA